MIVTAFQTYHGAEAKWLGQFVDRLPVAVTRTTVEGVIVYANRKFAGIFGFASASELRGVLVGTLYRNVKDQGHFLTAITQKGNLDDFTVPLKKRDGTPFWGAITARAVYDEDGLPQYFDCAVRDVTEELKKRPPLAADAEDVETGDHFCRMDLEGCFLSINEAASGMMGIIGRQLIGRRLPEMISPSYRELFAHFLTDIEEKGEKEGVLTIGDPDGHEHHLEFKATVVRDPAGRRQIQCTARDVTAKLKMEREAKATEKFRGVLEMAGGVSHRINQPLTIISNLTRELLSDLHPEGNTHRKLLKINDQIDNLIHLAKKIGGIKKYEAMDYVAGIKIVDIDKAS